MFKTLAIASTAMFAITAATGAMAADPKNTQTTDENAAPAPAPSDQPTASEKKYCVVDTPTGTRINRKTCKTRQQWMSQDQFDPLNP
jgi:hypothetical protein